jgi:hypothetical protein
VAFPREVLAHGRGDITIVVDDEDGFGIHARIPLPTLAQRVNRTSSFSPVQGRRRLEV